MSYSEQAYQAADNIIEAMLEKESVDYSPGRDEIARVFDEDLWHGNWDSSTIFDPDLGLEDLRFIQEDEYDQSMDEEEDKPESDEELGFWEGHYVFYA